MHRLVASLGCSGVLFLSLALGSEADETPPHAPPAEQAPSRRAPAERGSPQEVDDAQIDRWIEQLGDADFRRREEAVRRLSEAGVAALERVAEAAVSESPEVSWRAGEVLERIGVFGDEQAVEQVCHVMERLAAKSEHFGRRAAELKSRWREYRHERAAEQLQRLGARLNDGAYDDLLSFSPTFAPVILTPSDDALAFDLELDTLDLIGRELLEYEVPEAPPTVILTRPSPAAISDVEISPTLRRELDTPASDVVTARKVEAAEEAETASTTAESGPAGSGTVSGTVEESARRPALEEPPLALPALDIPSLEIPTLEPAAEDVPGTEVPASAPAIIAEEAEDLAPVIDTSGMVDYEFTFATTGFPVPADAVGFGGRTLQLGPSWKGSDEDLRWLRELSGVLHVTVSNQSLSAAAFGHIERMAQLQQLTLQQVRFDPEQVVEFKRRRPEVQIHAFGAAILGVSGEPLGGGLRITHLVPGSGADKAGLRIGDVLTRIDGEPIASFEALSWHIAARQPGEKVQVAFRRGKQTLARAVTLGRR